MDLDLRLATLGRRILLAGVVLYLISGVSQAALSPSVWTMAPMFAGLAALGLSVLPGAASFLAFVRKRTSGGPAARRRLLIAWAPVLVFIGMELLPHALNPCSISDFLDRPTTPSFCERILHGSGFGGKGELIEDIDVSERWHTLSHALLGAVPMFALYSAALRRWCPEIAGRSPGRG